MALKPKDAVFQMRIDEGLLNDFKMYAAEHDAIPSVMLRTWIRNFVKEAEARKKRQSA